MSVRNVTGELVQYWRARIRASDGDGVSLALLNPRSPGEAELIHKEGEWIVEWQFTQPLPPDHSKRLVWKAHFRGDQQVPMTVEISGDRVDAAVATLVLSWSGEEPDVQLRGK